MLTPALSISPWQETSACSCFGLPTAPGHSARTLRTLILQARPRHGYDSAPPGARRAARQEELQLCAACFGLLCCNPYPWYSRGRQRRQRREKREMASPFPGMDPYLERPDRWSGVHAGLIAVLREVLARQVAPRFFVDSE